mgnify:CR=1 FL=1
MITNNSTNGTSGRVVGVKVDNTFQGTAGEHYALGRRLSFERLANNVLFTREENPRAANARIDGFLEKGSVLLFKGRFKGQSGNPCLCIDIDSGETVWLADNHLNNTYRKGKALGAVAVGADGIETISMGEETLEDRVAMLAAQLAETEQLIAAKRAADEKAKAEKEAAEDAAAVARVLARGLKVE